MSRRYGRNQKRAHRARISELEANLVQMRTAHLMNEALLSGQRLQIAKLHADIEDAKNILGADHVAFEVQNMPLRELAHLIDAEQPVRMAVPGIIGRVMEVQALTMHARIDDYRFQRHYRFHFGDGRWAYGLTLEALHTTPVHILARRISQEVGEYIARDLKSGRRTPHGDRP